MTVVELKEMLLNLPDEMEIILDSNSHQKNVENPFYPVTEAKVINKNNPTSSEVLVIR